MTSHPFHRTIGKLVKNKFQYRRNRKVYFDEACDKDEGQRISLHNKSKGNHFRYCNVDILVAIDGKPKIIIEIEESYVTPGRVFGKIIASALSDSYQVKGLPKPCRLDGSILFIQVLDSSKLKEDSKKQGEWKHIEKQTRAILRKIPSCNITRYEIIWGSKKMFQAGKNGAKKLNRIINTFLE
jgi:hypothetical protein